jgi:hypothetical protein
MVRADMGDEYCVRQGSGILEHAEVLGGGFLDYRLLSLGMGAWR